MLARKPSIPRRVIRRRPLVGTRRVLITIRVRVRVRALTQHHAGGSCEIDEVVNRSELGVAHPVPSSLRICDEIFWKNYPVNAGAPSLRARAPRPVARFPKRRHPLPRRVGVVIHIVTLVSHVIGVHEARQPVREL